MGCRAPSTDRTSRRVAPRARRGLGWIAAASLLALACATEQTLETAAAKALISPSESEQIGLQVRQELQQQGVRFIEDPVVTGWVQQVANPLLEIARKARPDIQRWTLRIIDDPKTVNAFATGGGDVYVYSGLVLMSDSGAELAGVLAHELGHVVLRHVERGMVDAYGLEALAALATGKDPGIAKQMAASVAAKGALLAHSRSSEAQADEWGVIHADQAGYDPHGLVHFFQKLQQMEGKTPGITAWLSDHPTTPSRIQDVEQIIRAKNLGGSSNGPPGVDQVKQHIRALPPAPARAAPAG